MSEIIAKNGAGVIWLASLHSLRSLACIAPTFSRWAAKMRPTGAGAAFGDAAGVRAAGLSQGETRRSH